MFCPDYIFDACVACTARDFLSGEMALELVAKKYVNGLAEHYPTPILGEELTEPAEEILRFLNEIEANEQANDLLKDFSYYRLYFSGIGRERKLNPLFGSVEDAAKEREYNPSDTFKAFKAYVFGLRSETVPEAPVGWSLATDEKFPKLAALAGEEISLFDVL